MGTEENKKKYENKAKKVLYDYHPSLEGNMIDAQKNLLDTEKALNHKYELVQLDSQSDPICSSAGCDQYKHPDAKEKWDMDYPVPHFGMDRDIQESFQNAEIAEKIVGHKWKTQFHTDESKKKYSNPAKKVDYNFAPELDGDIKDANKNLADTEKRLDHVYELD